jgi:hypothetical protein
MISLGNKLINTFKMFTIGLMMSQGRYTFTGIDIFYLVFKVNRGQLLFCYHT